MSNKEIAIQYCLDVIAQKIDACELIIMSCKTFLNDLERDDLYFDEDAVNSLICFINELYLTEVVPATHFYLEPWQCFLICGLYGLYRVSTKCRKHKKLWCEVPRKSGKSQLISALSLFDLIFTDDAQVAIACNGREAATKINLKKAQQLSEQIDPKEKHLKQRYSSIKYKHNELFICASDAKRLSGLNCSLAICDEVFNYPDSKVPDILSSSQGTRANPLFIQITTAGFDRDSYAYREHQYSVDVLQGKIVDDNLFSLIYTLDESDDWQLEKNWYKANPNLGVSNSVEFLQAQVTKAINSPLDSSNIKAMHFNLWLENKSAEVYIPSDLIQSSMQPLDLNDDIFMNVEGVFAAVDLSTNTDITSVTYFIPTADKYYFINKYYLPEASLNSGRMKEQYKVWCEQGFITLTSGNVTDLNRITNDLMIVYNSKNLVDVAYDKWNSLGWATDATEKGLNCNQYSQTAGSMTIPMKQLERMILAGSVVLDLNPVTSWMFGNATVKTNTLGNSMLDKSKRANKIDGCVSILSALGIFMTTTRVNFNVW